MVIAPATPAPCTAARPLQIGPYRCDTPVVLAPMAGITNPGFRRLCREQGAGFYVCEMITSRGLVERNPLTFRMIAFDADEHPRSLQLYGVDPATVGAAVRMIVEQDLADHVDLNFGCPVPKVTRRGGGAALPYKRRLFDRIVRAAVDNAGPVPVTVKMRIGIDDEHRTHLEAGRIAADAGISAVALHARTAAQRYSGTADWSEIARLRDALPAELPVLGNGDIFSAADALAMVAETGCDGVVVGRGCLGRPWLFGDLEAAFAGRPLPPAPTLGKVAATLRRHAVLLSRAHGAGQGHPRRPQAHRLVPQGLRGGLRDPPPARARREPGRAGRTARHPRPAAGLPGRRRGPARTPGLAGTGRAARALAARPGRPIGPVRRRAGALGRVRGIPERDPEQLPRSGGLPRVGSSGAFVPSTTPATGGGRKMDCSVVDTPVHDVPSPYLDLDRSTDPTTGLDALGYDRAAVHTAAAERLARLGRWEQAYDHLRAAVRLMQGRTGPGDELDRLRREHAEARELSRRDSLTATYNRRYLDECLATLLDQPVDPAVRTLGLSVALVDIDHFKLVNDTYGHLLGDRVLQRLVGVLGSGLPGGAFCARFGGEEFALVLPGQGYAESVEICEAARDRVARHPWAEIADGLQVTVSVGVAHCIGWPTEVERLVGEADVLLYTAKQAGRNAVGFRDTGTGFVRLAGAAAARRSIPQLPAHEPAVRRPAVS